MFILEIVKSLENQRVDYAVVGGFAVALHGVVRGTIDLDLVIALDLNAYQKAENAFKDVGMEGKLPVSAKEIFKFRKEYIKNRNLIAWSFFDPRNPANVLDVIITEDLRKLKTVSKVVHGVMIKVASIESLIMMKKKSAREQDWEDIKALEFLME